MSKSAQKMSKQDYLTKLKWAKTYAKEGFAQVLTEIEAYIEEPSADAELEVLGASENFIDYYDSLMGAFQDYTAATCRGDSDVLN